jgi:dGTPase
VHEVLGDSHSRRIETLVTDCVLASAETFETDRPTIQLGERVLEATDTLREFMFQRVYLDESTLREARRGQEVVEALFHYYLAHPDRIPGFSLADDPAWRRAADYVSGMTDGYALKRARALGLVAGPAG